MISEAAAKDLRDRITQVCDICEDSLKGATTDEFVSAVSLVKISGILSILAHAYIEANTVKGDQWPVKQ